LDYPDFEIIILPDNHFGSAIGLRFSVLGEHLIPNTEHPSKGTLPELRIIPTGPVNPARKRDLAIDYARGEILAFIDDDAYPMRDWLKNAVRSFSDSNVAAVAGPAVTPGEDNLMQRASGNIYSSFLVSAHFTYRYLPGKRREVDDYPSCNLLVRKSVMQELGGFNTSFWPGEDTKLCLDITKKLKKKIIYDPDALVYHHRRELFIPHLAQLANYALHRGYFAKHFPQTSLKVSYFVPSVFLLGLAAGGALSLFFLAIRAAYFLILCLYLFLVFIFSISKELRLIPLIFSGIILTHIAYGFHFLRGLVVEKLPES